MSMLVVWGAILPWVGSILNVLILLTGLFLILLVLIQRGKGGGLSGAFGGAGGSSAFGSRAGDTFTRITIYVAAFWLVLIMVTIRAVQPRQDVPPPAATTQPAPANPPGEQQQ
jgi:preprotein translocase subunit SecG